MKYAYRTPKLYNLNSLLKTFREYGFSYFTSRFKGERANRSYSLLLVALEEEKWEPLQGEIRVKESDLTFPDIRFTKQNHKRFQSYMEEVKADFFLPQEHRSYKEHKVHNAQEVLMISVLEDNAGPRRISNPFKDWGIRTDRLLKAKVIQYKKAEGVPLEKNMEGVEVEDLSAHLSDAEDQVIEDKFIRPLIEKQRVSEELLDSKIADFEGHESYFQRRLLRLKNETSSNGRSYGEELNQLMNDTSLIFAGSTLEQFVALEEQYKEEGRVKNPDFIKKMALDRKAARFHPSGRKRNRNKVGPLLWELHDKYKKELRDYLELNGLFDGQFEIFFTNPRYSNNPDKFFNDTNRRVGYLLKEKARTKMVHIERWKRESHIKSNYVDELKTLKSIVGSHPEIEQQIEEYEGLTRMPYGIKIPESILDLNKTQAYKDRLELEEQLKGALTNLMPLEEEDFTYEKDRNKYTSPQYPHLTLYIRGRSGITPKKLKAGFFALNVVHLNSGADHIHIEFTKENRASYNHGLAQNGLVKVKRDDSSRVWVHEVMHSLEYLNPKVGNLVNAFYASRFKPEKYKEYARSRGSGVEMAFSGLWALYAGKIYTGHIGDDIVYSSEMITMGVQEFVSEENIINLAKRDYAHFLFCHALVTGKFKEYL